MGFWDTLGNALDSFGEMNQSAISDAAKLSTDELFQKVNTVNVLLNPLIYAACTEELKKRVHRMAKSDLLEFYDEFASLERTDAKDILIDELKIRGYVFDND
jgi:hypothetical protein